MAQFGRFGKFPFRFGDEPSPQAKAFGALLSLEGVGLYPPDDPQGDTTLDGAWHQALANGLGAVDTVMEAAVFQAWPNLATDLIGEYERILGVSPPIGSPDQQRRDVVTPLWVGDIRSAYPDLQASLTAIDQRYTVVTPNRAATRTVGFGKLFARADEAALFPQGRTASQYPNYSDDFVVRVVLDIGNGIGPSGPVGAAKQRGRDLLDSVLPAWCDYSVALHGGFILDISLLDETSL